jgi:hypothetical protein
MRKKYRNILIAVFIIIAFLFLYLSNANYSQQKKFKYVGAKVCATCHDDEKDSSYKIWEKSNHARAFVTLATPRALEQAEEAGVKEHPQKSEKCLKCHITGAGLDKSYFADTYNKEEGITCEACHGPGSEYIDISIMEDKTKFLANGGMIPTEEHCLKCHGEPFFTFKEKFREIEHPIKKSK